MVGPGVSVSYIMKGQNPNRDGVLFGCLFSTMDSHPNVVARDFRTYLITVLFQPS